MASVCNTAALRYRYKTDDDYQAGELQSIRTVREKILHQCINRFTSASCQLKTYQDQRLKFVASGSSKEVPNLIPISGLLDHDSFKTCVQKIEILRVLQEFGLSKYEIEVIFQETSRSTRSSSIHLSDDVVDRNLLSTLHAVLKKLCERETISSTQNSEHHEKIAGAVEQSFLDYKDDPRPGEIGRNPNESLNTVATRAVVQRKAHRQPAVHPQHPLNHLAALEQELFAKRERVNGEHKSSGKARIKKVAKRGHVQVGEFKYLSSLELKVCSSACEKVKLADEQCSEVNLVSYSESRDVGSLWDVKDMHSNIILDASINNVRCKGVAKNCSGASAVVLSVQESSLAKKRKKNDFSEGFVSMPNPVNLVPLSQIADNCIPLAQLKVQFPNYLSGNPSKTLYLKNLCHQTSPEDLVNLFGHFDVGSSRVMYRLLRGRMRGQAFVKFPSVETAQEAHNACLGYMMRGKPLVIEFGKENCGR